MVPLIAQSFVSASWEQGYQTYLSAAHSVAPSTARYGPAPAAAAQDPREADDTKASYGAASLGWLPRSRDLYARDTSRGSCDVRHDDQGQGGASGHSVPVSSFSKEACTGEETRGISQMFPYRCNSQDQDQQDGRTEVTTEPTEASPPEPLAGEDQVLSGQLILVVSLQLGCCGIPSLLTFGKRTRATLNRTSHHHRRDRLILERINSILTSTSEPRSRTPLLLRLFTHCTTSFLAREAINQYHTRVVYYTARWPVPV